MKKLNIALMGQPNAGKSTVFNVLSDIKSAASNFSGTTVEYTESDIEIRGREFHIVDLPGVYSLNPGDEAEKLTYKYLTEKEIDLVINVVDASLLSRSLELTVELLEFGLPMVIALNMWDEAERKGLKIYPERLEKALRVPVVTTSALYGKGVKELVDRCYDVLAADKMEVPPVAYTSHIEENVQRVERALSGFSIKNNGSRRFYAIKAIENPGLLPADMLSMIAADLEEVRGQITRLHRTDGAETVSYERHHIAMKLNEEISHFIDRKEVPLREKIDRFLLHPLLGYFPLLVFFLASFVAIYFIGNGLSASMDFPLKKIPPLYASLKGWSPLAWYSLDGIFQGFSGALGIVLPYFLPLIFLTAIFEDTGYLSRIAFLMDGIMHRIGLHGKSVAPFIMGFGCSVPALYATRILENRRERMLTGLLIPFIPCSARTTVIFALAIAFTGPWWALVIYLFTALVVGLTGKLLSLFVGKPTGLILEIPGLKVPSFKVAFSRSWFRVKDFLKFALPFLLVGSLAMSWLQYFHVDRAVDRVFAPLLKGILGLPAALGSTLVFGFFRKELIIVMANNALGVSSTADLPLSPGQVVVFLVFVTLYFPCFSTFIVLWKEFKWRIVLVSTLLSIFVATVSAYLFRLVLL